MPETIQQDEPNALISGPNLRRRLNICAMTEGRWEKAGRFPPPDLRINGRKYWREETYARWLVDQQEAEAARRDEGGAS